MRLAWLAVAMMMTALTGARAQAPVQAPPFETRKVSEHVYAFRYGGYQSLFVVGRDGVLVTDPSARNKPDAIPTFIAEIRKITPAPIRYVVYTHSGYDHIAGGKPFKDMGATVIAHRNTRTQIERMNNAADVVRPDRVVGDGITPIRLGDVVVNLAYFGPTRGDNMLTLWAPQDKVVFAADWVGVGSAPCMNTSCMPAIWNYDAALQSLLALDWTTFVPGHSGPGGRFGTKADIQRVRDYIADLNTFSGGLAAENRCNAQAWDAVAVPAKYDGYVTQAVYSDHVERYCLAWNQGS